MQYLTEEKKTKLKEIYYEVEKDFQRFPFIRTTEDFFRWREAVKAANGNDGNLRNQEIEDMIKGNESLELLYDWTKFCRMIDRAEAGIYTTKIDFGIENIDTYKIKAANMLHRRLIEQKKANVENLFGVLRMPELSFGIRNPLQRTINTPYEFEKAIVEEDENEPWPAILFVTLLKAYGITGDDLLIVGREAEQLEKDYTEKIETSYPLVKDNYKKYFKSI